MSPGNPGAIGSLLPVALLKIQSLPGPTGYMPFEALHGRIPSIIRGLQGDLNQLVIISWQQQFTIRKDLSSDTQNVTERPMVPTNAPAHTYSTEDMVWIKC